MSILAALIAMGLTGGAIGYFLGWYNSRSTVRMLQAYNQELSKDLKDEQDYSHRLTVEGIRLPKEA